MGVLKRVRDLFRPCETRWSISWDASVGGTYKHGVMFALTEPEARGHFAQWADSLGLRVGRDPENSTVVILLMEHRHGRTIVKDSWRWPSADKLV